MKNILSLRAIAKQSQLILLIILFSFIAFSAVAENRLKLATTTSTEDTGLLGSILPPFEKKFNVKVDVISVGTGKAIEIAKNGDVDVILVHDRAAEDKFVADGFGVNRRDVMYNTFVLIGPHNDLSHIKGKDVLTAFKQIYESRQTFVSRGDKSGTHSKELSLWKGLKMKPDIKWYMETGQGMGATLVIANEKQGYCLADYATYLAFKSKINLEVLVEDKVKLLNPYGVIAVSPQKHPKANYVYAMAFIGFLTSAEGQKLIGDFKKDGETLFYPSAYKK